MAPPWEARCRLVLATKLVPPCRFVPARDVKLIPDHVEVAAHQGRLTSKFGCFEPVAQYLLGDVLVFPSATLVIAVADFYVPLADPPLEVVAQAGGALRHIEKFASPGQ